MKYISRLFSNAETKTLKFKFTFVKVLFYKYADAI